MKNVMLVLLSLVAGFFGAAVSLQVFQKPATVPAAPESPRAADAETTARLARLEKRVDDLERAAASPADSAGSEAGSVRAATAGRIRKAAAGGAEKSTKKRGPLDAKAMHEALTKMLHGGLDYRRDQALFQWLFKHPESVDAVIADLKARIAEDPRNPDLENALAAAWISKLESSATTDPEKGAMWQQAAGAYDKAIDIDPNNWVARYGKAFGTSMIPAFLGQRPKAIAEFQSLMELQEEGPPKPEQAQVYYRLGTLYKDAGNVTKARAIWTRGLARHPDDEQIRQALAVSKEK